MTLHINGESVLVPDDLVNVYDLLVHFGLDQKVVIVELNAEILQKDDHSSVTIIDGDRIEIVHFVGGG